GLLLLIVFRKFVPKVPGSIVVLVLGTVVAAVFNLPVETIGSRFGGIPQGLPGFKPLSFDFATMKSLISPAITVAMLGAIESLMSAVVADRMTGDKHNPNVELIGQGIANVVT